MVSYVPQVREEQMVRICLYVHACVAPPMSVGAWSMAIMLWLLHEYYYYYNPHTTYLKQQVIFIHYIVDHYQ